MKNLSWIFPLIACALASCQPKASHTAPQRADVDTLLNRWHRAAAAANATDYFAAMTDSAVFLGTDPAERWVKPAFYAFAKPYFDKGKAWNFTPFNRFVSFTDEGKTAYFDELLQTQMGVCRGSGVAQQTAGGWKIAHYNLAVAIHNDLMKEYISLIKKDTLNNYFLKKRND
jgi:ketosteroid isomerase-like protein